MLTNKQEIIRKLVSVKSHLRKEMVLIDDSIVKANHVEAYSLNDFSNEVISIMTDIQTMAADTKQLVEDITSSYLWED